MARLRAVGVVALVVALFGLAGWLRPEARPIGPSSVDRIRPPSKAVLELAALEHPRALSDLLWLQVVQSFGREDVPPEAWPSIERDLRLALAFDPRNEVAYLGGAVMFTHHAHDIELAQEILRQGVEALPDSAKLWSFLGFIAYFIREAPEEASRYWARAARCDGAPHYMGGLAALARYQAGERRGALRVVEELLRHSGPEDPAHAFLEFTRDELVTEAQLEAYDAACSAFFDARGRWPSDADALIEADLIRGPAVDVRDNPIRLDVDPDRDPPCIARSDFVDYRQFERARDLIGSEKPEP